MASCPTPIGRRLGNVSALLWMPSTNRRRTRQLNRAREIDTMPRIELLPLDIILVGNMLDLYVLEARKVPKHAPKFKLAIDMIPSPLWGVNPRTSMGPADWDRMRLQSLEEYEHKCAVCGVTGRLDVDEKYEYDDLKRVARFVGIWPLCKMCHGVKHWGRTSALAAEGKIDIKDYLAHFIKVNSEPMAEMACFPGEGAEEAFQSHLSRCVERFEKRSAWQDWTVDWDEK